MHRLRIQFNLRLLLTATLGCELAIGLTVHQRRANRLQAEVDRLQDALAQNSHELALIRLRQNNVHVYDDGVKLSIVIDHRIELDDPAALRDVLGPYQLTARTRIISAADAAVLFPAGRELESLALIDCTLEPGAVARLARLQGLKMLELKNVQIEAEDFFWPQIAQLPVEDLSISDWRLNDETLRSLRLGSKLKKLTLQAHAVTGEGLSILAGIGRLEILDVAKTGVTESEFASLAKQYPKLTVVQRSGRPRGHPYSY